jgi:hypothetical protein
LALDFMAKDKSKMVVDFFKTSVALATNGSL